jgi:hypothetical protein
VIGYRFATAGDIARYYEGRPHPTLRAVVLTLNEEPAAVIGVANEGGYGKLFSEYKPDYAPHLKSMATLRALKLAMKIVETSRLPVVAVRDEDEPDSDRILKRLGFVHEEEDLYRWAS